MLAMRSNVYVSALQILQFHPGKGPHQAVSIPGPRDHLGAGSVMPAVRLEQSHLERARPHCADLL